MIEQEQIDTQASQDQTSNKIDKEISTSSEPNRNSTSFNEPIKSAPITQNTVGTKKGGKYVQTKYGEVKMTEDGSKFECKVCQHTFTRIESVHQHMAIHDESLAMKCDLCDEKFAWKSTLRKHRMTVHEGIKTELTCTEPGCDRVFKSFGHRKVSRSDSRKMLLKVQFLQ